MCNNVPSFDHILTIFSRSAVTKFTLPVCLNSTIDTMLFCDAQIVLILLRCIKL